MVGGFAAALAEALFVVLVVPYVAFAIEAPRLTDALLSPKWRGTGPYLSSLVLPAVLLASTCWLDRAFDSFRRQRVAFALEASFTITAVALVGCLTHFVAPTSVIRAFAVLAFVYYWFYFFMTFIACNFDLEKFRHALDNRPWNTSDCSSVRAARASAGAAAMALLRVTPWLWQVASRSGSNSGMVPQLLACSRNPASSRSQTRREQFPMRRDH